MIAFSSTCLCLMSVCVTCCCPEYIKAFVCCLDKILPGMYWTRSDHRTWSFRTQQGIAGLRDTVSYRQCIWALIKKMWTDCVWTVQVAFFLCVVLKTRLWIEFIYGQDLGVIGLPNRSCLCSHEMAQCHSQTVVQLFHIERCLTKATPMEHHTLCPYTGIQGNSKYLSFVLEPAENSSDRGEVSYYKQEVQELTGSGVKNGRFREMFHAGTHNGCRY